MRRLVQCTCELGVSLILDCCGEFCLDKIEIIKRSSIYLSRIRYVMVHCRVVCNEAARECLAISRQISLRIRLFSPEKGLCFDKCFFFRAGVFSSRLASKAVQSAALTLQRIHDIHGSDGLSLGVFSVGDSIANDVLEEDLEHATCLLVDETGDTLNSTSTCQPTNSRLRYALDVVSEYLAMTLCSSFSESLASFTATRHLLFLSVRVVARNDSE